MSYLALARKWRPRRFEDVRGQDAVVKALSHALSRDQLHPAILLTGTRGVGKTTLARLVAKSLNCETGVTATPCNVCTACKEVSEGRFIDLLEIDAASNTGVDNVRELIDNAQYAPARGRYKVYLIDEVHMLSKPAFNALLKTLEEPPPHVKFILATTDPQKLLPTVLSRCLQFNLKRLPQSLIREAFADILKQEGVEAEFGALAEVARAADGSMRDGLSLLDQAIAFAGGGTLTRAGVEEMLGSGGRRTLFDLVDALAEGDGERLLAGLRRLDEVGLDYAGLLNELAAILQRIAVLQLLPAAADTEDDPALEPLSKKLAAEDVQVYYQIAVLGRRDLPYAPDPRLGFEMTVLRLFAFRPGAGAAPAVPGREGGGAKGESRGPTAAPASASAKTVPVASFAVAKPPSTPSAPAVGIAESRPAPKPAVMTAPPVDRSEPARVAPVAAAASTDVAAASAEWAEAIEALRLDGMVRQLARHCARVRREGGCLHLLLDTRARHLLNEERRGALERALVQAGLAQRIELAVGEDAATLSPAAAEDRRVLERQREAERAIENDPVVRAMKETFGATVRPGSIRPLD